MILGLSTLISRAIERSLEERVAVAFSGGLDSTVIAAIARKHAEVGLFAAGVAESEDLEYAGRVAGELGLPVERVLIDDASAMEAYGKIHAAIPLELNKVEILVPAYLAAKAASGKGYKVMLFGSAAEELFVGYDRYYAYKEEGKDVDAILKEEYRTLPQRDIGWVRKVSRMAGMEARFPLYDRELADLMFSVPLAERMDDRRMKKGILREAAKVLGTPETAIKRKKRAMQYGSGVHRMLLRHADEINKKYPAPH